MSGRAEREPDPELPRPLGDAKGGHSVQADGGQQKADTALIETLRLQSGTKTARDAARRAGRVMLITSIREEVHGLAKVTDRQITKIFRGVLTTISLC